MAFPSKAPLSLWEVHRLLGQWCQLHSLPSGWGSQTEMNCRKRVSTWIYFGEVQLPSTLDLSKVHVCFCNVPHCDCWDCHTWPMGNGVWRPTSPLNNLPRPWWIGSTTRATAVEHKAEGEKNLLGELLYCCDMLWFFFSIYNSKYLVANFWPAKCINVFIKCGLEALWPNVPIFFSSQGATVATDSNRTWWPSWKRALDDVPTATVGPQHSQDVWTRNGRPNSWLLFHLIGYVLREMSN